MLDGVLLERSEEEYLLSAMASSLRVKNPRLISDWLQGYLFSLLPFGFLTCIHTRNMGQPLSTDSYACSATLDFNRSLQKTVDQFALDLLNKLHDGLNFPLLLDDSQAMLSQPTYQTIFPTAQSKRVLVSRAVMSHNSSYFFVLTSAQSQVDRHKLTYLMDLTLPHLCMAVLRANANDFALDDSREAQFVLSAREIEVLQWVAKGKSNQQIAEKLFLSPFTVKNHIQNILKRLGAKNRVEAASLLGSVKQNF
jgi:DNA-binding CsgD family transcriptional regulator